MKTIIKAITGFGLAVIMTTGIFTLVPNADAVSVYAATKEPTIRVGLPNSVLRNRNQFLERYKGYIIYYNDKAYTEVEFFDAFKGLDFSMTLTTPVRDKEIIVALREGNTQATAPTPATETVMPKLNDNAHLPQATNATTALGREGYASDVEYMMSEEYTEAVRQEFYRLINEYRKANGLRELEVNLELQDYADIRASERIVRSGHTRLDGSPAGSGWYNSKNNVNTRYSENEAGNTRLDICPEAQAAEYFNRWKNSDGHNKHMLYDFKPQITMAFGIAPKLNKKGDWVLAPAIFAAGY